MVRTPVARHPCHHGRTLRRQRNHCVDRRRGSARSAHSENAAMLTGSQHAMLRCELGDPDAVVFFEDVMVRWPGLAIMARPGLAYAYAAAGDVERGDRRARRGEHRRLLDRCPRLGVVAVDRHAGLRRRADRHRALASALYTARWCRSAHVTPSTGSAATTWAASSGRSGCSPRSAATSRSPPTTSTPRCGSTDRSVLGFSSRERCRDAGRALDDAAMTRGGRSRSTRRSASMPRAGRRAGRLRDRPRRETCSGATARCGSSASTERAVACATPRACATSPSSWRSPAPSACARPGHRRSDAAIRRSG